MPKLTYTVAMRPLRNGKYEITFTLNGERVYCDDYSDPVNGVADFFLETLPELLSYAQHLDKR